MLFVYCILSFAMVFMATDSVSSESLPVPDFCYERPQGGGRASHPRYWYNVDDDECQLFRWTGGVSEGNVFLYKSECEETCKRDGTFARNQLSCEFRSNMGRTCDFASIAGPDQISLCLDQDVVNMTEDQCTMLGCCWHLGICFQDKGSLFQGSCSVRRNTATQFWGKVVFQSDVSTPEWTGSITFSQEVVGDFCILRKGMNYVSVSEDALGDRRHFILPHRREVRAGEQLTIIFEGRFNQSPINATNCVAISRGN